jgi:6-phosphogluconolactonase
LWGVAVHPKSRQKRISFTERIINDADRVSILVTGKEKAKVLSQIIKKEDVSKNYPASNINPTKGILEWFVDKEAASLL